ncbi:MAG: hypothetical protein HZB67_00160 [Candidatus Aenigmarchaeota archaeon]|nr:hypothetical protein [Candidatus Aenigmarchaeota archaeon]
MKNKGISLSIETVVVMILAATVLVAMMFFFNSTWNPFLKDIDWQKKQLEACQTYLSLDPTCKQSNYPDSILGLAAAGTTARAACTHNPAFELDCKSTAINAPTDKDGKKIDQTFYCVSRCCASYGCNPTSPSGK